MAGHHLGFDKGAVSLVDQLSELKQWANSLPPIEHHTKDDLEFFGARRAHYTRTSL